jgi:hypothetical protein
MPMTVGLRGQQTQLACHCNTERLLGMQSLLVRCVLIKMCTSDIDGECVDFGLLHMNQRFL